MTIASATSRISYVGDGSTTAFAVPFFFAANADLVVYLQDTLGNQVVQLLGSNYNLTGATLSAGGTCTFTVAPAIGYLISIYRDPPATQTTSYNNNDPFAAKSHELALDKLTTLAQRTRDLVNRSVHLSDGEATVATTLAAIAIRKNKLFGFDGTGALVYPLGPTFVASTFVGAAYVDTRATAVVTSFPVSVNAVRTAGYATAGDGGAATYKRVVSLASTTHGFQSADGAFWQIAERVFRPEMFSSTADTTAIQIAIDAANALGICGEVRLSNKNYRATTQAGHTYCLRLYGNVSLLGEAAGVKDGATAGTGSIISWGSNVPNANDIILWNGNTNDQRISGIQFMPDGFTATVGNITGLTLYGSNVINVNAGASSVIANGMISDNLIGPSNGASICFSDATADWSDGSVVRNFIWGGILGLAILDNATFRDNSFNGLKVAMDITCATGAGNVVIEHNNGIAAGGAIILRSGFGPKVRDNYFEVVQTFLGFNGYLFNINGTAGTIANCEFKNNIASQLGDFGLTGLVFFDNTTYADIDGTIMTNSGATPISGIVVSANNLRPYCGKAVSLSAGINPTGVTRNGWTVSTATAPRGYDVPLTLLNSWTTPTGYEPPSVRCERDGTCHITGAVQNGTVTAGTVIFTLPLGFKPITKVLRVLPANAGAVTAQIITSGDFSWFAAGASATITGVACTYMTGTE